VWESRELFNVTECVSRCYSNSCDAKIEYIMLRKYTSLSLCVGGICRPVYIAYKSVCSVLCAVSRRTVAYIQYSVLRTSSCNVLRQNESVPRRQPPKVISGHDL
jgi:hypothetical protein